jgi:hypothetical protein
MSFQNVPDVDLYARLAEIDEGAYLRIRQMRPVERAAAPIVDHNIQLIERARAVRPWYLGETRAEPPYYMSIQLDPCTNDAVRLLGAFVATVKAFPPGAFPGHCIAVRTLEFTTKYLINTLASLVAATAFAHSLRSLGALFAAFSDPANMTLSAHDLHQRIDAKLAQLVDSFRAISREFAMRERQIAFSAIPSPLDENAAEVLAVAKDTNAVVKRIDARDVKRGKRQTEIDKQDKCFAIWEAGQGKEGVIALAGKKRVSRGNVFDYYKRELTAIGVGSASEFIKLLKRRERRLSRSSQAS